MSVVVEFTISSEEFTLGRVLSTDTDVHLSLEAIVPTGSEILPFFWARSADGDFDAFERDVRNHPEVYRLSRLDVVGDAALYRITWESAHEGLVNGINEANGTILTGEGANGKWMFTVRFADHADLATLQNYLTGHAMEVYVDRISTLKENERGSFSFGLTEDQRRALVFAVSGGYFEVPREIDLSDVAAELDISRQAASELVRRGTNTVLRRALLEA